MRVEQKSGCFACFISKSTAIYCSLRYKLTPQTATTVTPPTALPATGGAFFVHFFANFTPRYIHCSAACEHILSTDRHCCTVFICISSICGFICAVIGYVLSIYRHFCIELEDLLIVFCIAGWGEEINLEGGPPRLRARALHATLTGEGNLRAVSCAIRFRIYVGRNWGEPPRLRHPSTREGNLRATTPARRARALHATLQEGGEFMGIHPSAREGNFRVVGRCPVYVSLCLDIFLFCKRCHSLSVWLPAMIVAERPQRAQTKEGEE